MIIWLNLAEKNNTNLEFEAAVAGGIPILKTIKEGLATNVNKKSLWNFKWNN